MVKVCQTLAQHLTYYTLGAADDDKIIYYYSFWRYKTRPRYRKKNNIKLSIINHSNGRSISITNAVWRYSLIYFIFIEASIFAAGNISTETFDVPDNGTNLIQIYDGGIINTNTISNTKQDFLCYENFTVYYPIYLAVQFWIEGVLLIG